MSSVTVGMWVDFFLGAGIPARDAAQYAQTFHSHRISLDMLLDLNKEYLRDMGIVVLGDIIAILKQAKEVQGTLTSNRVLRQGASEGTASTRPGTIPVGPKIDPSQVRSAPSLHLPPPRAPVPQPKPVAAAAITPLPSGSGVSSRLGPPAAKRFAEFKPDNVFSRLGEDDPVNEAATRTVSLREDVIKARVSVFARVSPESNRVSSTPLEPETRPKKKKYIMIQTLPDGTKLRKIVSPEDPILDRVKITQRVSAPREDDPPRARRPAPEPRLTRPPQRIAPLKEPIRHRQPILPPSHDEPTSRKKTSVHQRLSHGSGSHSSSRPRIQGPEEESSRPRHRYVKGSEEVERSLPSRMYSDKDRGHHLTSRLGRKSRGYES